MTIIVCPCGKWHEAPVRATETFRKRFPCGLRVHLEPGFSEYDFKRKPAEIVGLAAGQEHLYIHLEQQKR